MSGMEVIGVVLGVLPLVISAMEYYEETAKLSRAWWKIKRTHRRDTGLLKDCQLRLRLHLQELLHPLLLNGIISRTEFDSLLTEVKSHTEAKSQTWDSDSVNEALRERLPDSEICDRYLAIVVEMRETVKKLAKTTMIDDEGFQTFLQKQSKSGGESQQANELSRLMKDQFWFELKRTKYTFTADRRQALITEFNEYSATLDQYLYKIDRLSESEPAATANVPSRKVLTRYRPLLSFWESADRVFKLITQAWQCNCADLHCALLMLQTCAGQFKIDLILKASPRPDDVSDRHWKDQPLLIRQETVKDDLPMRKTVVRSDSALYKLTPKNILSDGLCHAFTTLALEPKASPIGFLKSQDEEYVYDLYRVPEEPNDTLCIALEETLQQDSKTRLFRSQRYALALTLASSLLQYHSTPWLNSPWTANSIRLRQIGMCRTDAHLPQGMPYITSTFSSKQQTLSQDDFFTALGIILLELCFSRRIQDHPLWLEYARETPDHLVGILVAREWAKDVQLEADRDYASAVDWCLSSHASVRHADWRAEFAQNVVHPLQNCVDYVSR